MALLTATVLKVVFWCLTLSVTLMMTFYLGRSHIGSLTACEGGNAEPLYTIRLPPGMKNSQSAMTKVDLQVDESKHLAFFPSKFVSVRAVYIDDRPRDGHKNATVFLVNILKNITDDNLIVGCQVGSYRAENFKVKLIGETPLWRAYPSYNKINHEEVLINCYDVPAKDGDQGYIYYKTSKDSEVEMAVSEHLVVRPQARVQPTSPEGIKYNITVLTCTKVFGGNAPWFLEWLRYQKHIGVDHVHIDADDAFFRELSKEKMAFVTQEMESGFLSVHPWVMWLANGREVWYHNQGLILEDCGYRFRGTYDFMFVLDTDDFFVPRIPNEPKVHYYIDKYFNKKTGTCKFRWIEYFPDKNLNHSGVPNLTNGNVTSLLFDYTHYMQGNRKSIHRTQALVDTATHYAFQMTDGYQRFEASEKEAYIAHVRNGRAASFYKTGLVHSLP